MLRVEPLEGGGHEYLYGDKRVPGVTEILDVAGLIHHGGASDFNLDRAADRGKMLHMAAEDLDRGEDHKWIGAEWMPYLDSYQLFKQDFRFKPELIEVPMWDSIHRYAGQIDRTGTVECRKAEAVNVTLDLKFTAAISAHVGLQLAGYNNFFPDAHQRKRLVVRPMKNGKYEVQWCDDVDSYFHDISMFFAALSISKWKDKKYGLGMWT